jgi:LacI family transcriptional regulator
MLGQDNPPTAFLTSSILIALGVRRAVTEAGLTLGRDVSVITHDDGLSFLPNAGEQPMFTATRSSIRDAGKRCAEMLIDQIEDKCETPAHELWEAELVVGQSTGPAPD